MEEKNAKEAIAEQKEKLEKLKSENEKKSKKFKIHTIIFIAIVVVTLIAGIFIGNTLRDLCYQKLVVAFNNNDIKTASSFLKYGAFEGYKDGAVIYQNVLLGNNNNCIIKQKGKILSIDGSRFQSIDGGLVRLNNQGEETIYNDSVSYLNKLNDEAIVFRDDNSNLLLKFDLVSERTTAISKSIKVGETIVDNGKIYFIDLENHHLCTFDESNNKKEVLNYQIDSFAVLGKYFVILDTNHVLGIVSKSSARQIHKLENITTFTVSDKIYAQSGNTIFSFSINFDKATEVCKDKGNLIFAGENGIYTLDNNCLMLINGSEKKAIAKDISICKEIYEIGSNQIIVHNVSIENSSIIDDYRTYDF